MITKKKVVLIGEQQGKIEFFSKFEAIEFAENDEQIRDIWRRNKTPIVSKSKDFATDNYSIVQIPNELAKCNRTEDFTEFCYANGFECGEFQTGEVFDTKDDRCFMCEIANHRGFASLSSYNQYVDKTVDCIIYESANFYVVPELGALKQGYLMIVPKQHILSVAQFPESLRGEYQEVCEDIERILLETFDGRIVCFMEHGSGPSGKTSHAKSIVHAHTHVVVDFILKRKFKEMVQLKPFDDIATAKETHYFSYQEGSHGKLFIAKDPRVYVQRQFPRQVMAPDQYNWRWYDFSENTEATLFHLCEYLRHSNGRIYERSKDFVEGFSKRPRKKQLCSN